MITNKWDLKLGSEMNEPYFKQMFTYLKQEYKIKNIYPPKKDIFNAMVKTDFDKVKVVILGQDPYHGANEAHGYSFSVKDGVKIPPSLKNIFIELENDLGVIRKTTNLEDWADQGVLLLNTILTVEENKPLSHKNIGWEIFTNKIIAILNDNDKPIVFILWGAHARSKKYLITNDKHMIIECVHPSPLSAHNGFFGSRPFSKTNNFLVENKIEKINW